MNMHIFMNIFGNLSIARLCKWITAAYQFANFGVFFDSPVAVKICHISFPAFIGLVTSTTGVKRSQWTPLLYVTRPTFSLTCAFMPCLSRFRRRHGTDNKDRIYTATVS